MAFLRVTGIFGRGGRTDDVGIRVVKRVRPVKDDQVITEVATLILHESGFIVERVSSVADAPGHVPGASAPAVAPLNLTLPETSSILFLRSFRQRARLTGLPLLVLAARARSRRSTTTWRPL